MTSALVLGVFLVDVLLVSRAAWLTVVAAGLSRRGLLEPVLGWLLAALAWIVGAGVLLGLMGALGRNGFLVVHAIGFAALLAVGPWRRAAAPDAKAWLTDCWRLVSGRTTEGWLSAVVVPGLLALGVGAAVAEPTVYDALAYRLPRIAGWLQDGTIRHFATDDPRINYMPVAPDVVIAWLLGATTEGFRLAALAQVAGGALLLGATFGLARLAGLSRLAALGAVALVLGMANVAVQFTTIQSDLFTAGIFAASYLLWHRAWLRGEGSWLAGLGVALAFAAKGTMFYLAPGAALWVGWLIWQRRTAWRALLPTAAGGLLAGLLLVVPASWRNLATYGGAFGPRDAVVLHHGDFHQPGQIAAKLVRNLGTSAVQLFEPNAQPVWLQGVSHQLGELLMQRQPAEADPYVFIGQSRREQLERVMQLTEPDADVVTCGLLGALLFVVALPLAWARRRDAGATQVLVWGGGVVVYLLVQHGLVQWHHWAFRFMVLAAPWAAVAGAWAVTALPGKVRVAAWTLLLVSAADVFCTVQLRTSQAAWQAWTRPERSASFYYYSHWRAWALQLDHVEEPVRLAFPINQVLSAFYRQSPPRRVELASLAGLTAPTAEAALGKSGGWLVVPPEKYMGLEGRVLGRTWPPDLAAYRLLRPGEQPRPLLYVNRLVEGAPGRSRRELFLRTWADVPVQLEMFNTRDTACPVTVRTPTGTVNETLGPGAMRVVELPMPADVLTLVTIDFPAVDAPAGGLLLVRLAP